LDDLKVTPGWSKSMRYNDRQGQQAPYLSDVL